MRPVSIRATFVALAAGVLLCACGQSAGSSGSTTTAAAAAASSSSSSSSTSSSVTTSTLSPMGRKLAHLAMLYTRIAKRVDIAHARFETMGKSVTASTPPDTVIGELNQFSATLLWAKSQLATIKWIPGTSSIASKLEQQLAVAANELTLPVRGQYSATWSRTVGYDFYLVESAAAQLRVSLVMSRAAFM